MASLAQLRLRAEQALADGAAVPPPGAAADADARKQFHELEVNQIELEMQSMALAELQAQKEHIENGLKHYAQLYDQAPVAFFSLARDGRIVRANLAAGMLFHSAAAALIGKPFEQFVAAHEQGGLRHFLGAVFGSAARQVLEVALFETGQAGAPARAQIRIEANVDTDTQVCRMVVTDLGDPVERASALRRAFVILDTISEGVMVTDAQHRIVSVNPAFTAITGYRAEEAIGRDPAFLGDGVRAPLFSPAVRAQLLATGSWQGELGNRRKDGRLYTEWLSVTLMRAAHGGVANFVGVFFDITERKEAELALLNAHRALDRRVAERTSDLMQANRMLRQEIVERERAEVALGRAERFFHATLDALGDRVLVLDNGGRIVHANKACRSFATQSVLGADYLALCAADPGWRRGAGAQLAAGIRGMIAGALGSYSLEYELDAHGVAYSFLAKVTLFESDGPLRVVVAHTDITERKAMEGAVRQSHAQLRQLAAHLETVKEEERKRISRDVHDELGQNLLALRLDISMLAERTGQAHPRLHQRATEVLLQLDGTMRSVHGIINHLRPPVLDLGLQAAIEWQMGDFRRRCGIACGLRLDDEAVFDGIGHDTQVVLFRVVQEALTNIKRHARASRADIELRAAGAALVLTVADDGVGFGPQDRNKSQCFGLLGIGERIAALGGQFDVDGAGGGCRLTIRLPLPPPGVAAVAAPLTY